MGVGARAAKNVGGKKRKGKRGREKSSGGRGREGRKKIFQRILFEA